MTFQKQKSRTVFTVDVESFAVRIGILCVSIVIILGVHLATDRQYMIRRVYDYYSSYLVIFIFFLFIFFAIHLRISGSQFYKFWKCTGWGGVYGCLAGIIGYFLGIATDIFMVKQHSTSFLFQFSHNPFEYLMLICTYPIVALKSWMYGGLIGLVMFSWVRFFLKAVR